MVDDELYALLGKFAEGVRVLVTSDSCHSGTMTKLAYYEGTVAGRTSIISSEERRYRYMRPEVALHTYRGNKAFYDKILKVEKLKNADERMKASVLLISGCQDNQLSMDGDFNGLFTAQLLRVWNDGAFRRNYRRFHKAMVSLMPPDQTPNFYRAGQIDRGFEKQVPFTI